MGSKIQKIFREYYDSYASRFNLPDFVRKAAYKIKNCRTKLLGGHVQECPQGHYYRIWYNSCKHRVCPQCAYLYIENWIRKISEKIIDINHHHVIFTMPHEFNELFLLNKKEITSALFEAVKLTLFKISEERYQMKPGFILALHTWSKKLNLHAHIHCLISSGGITKDGKWEDPEKVYFAHYEKVMLEFRKAFCNKVQDLLKNGKLKIISSKSYADYHNEINVLRGKFWKVKLMEKYVHGKGVLKYIGRYLRGGCLSEKRLISCKNGYIEFRYKDSQDGDKNKTLKLPIDEFFRRFFLHVPLPGSKLIRHYGLYSSSKIDELNSCRKQLGFGDVKKIEDLTWTEVLESNKDFYKSSTKCPVCNSTLVIGDRFKPGEPIPLPMRIPGKDPPIIVYPLDMAC